MSAVKQSSRPRASSTKALSAEILDGRRATGTLSEVLAVDTLRLLEVSFPEIELTRAEKDAVRSTSITARMAAAAAALHDRFGLACLERLHAHPADTVRGWAPYVVGARPALSLAERLELVRLSADDAHFGVREWAWLGIRAHLASNIREAIQALTPWSTETSPRLRRFATESTRPRGVWATKIDALLAEPDLGLPLLTPLRDDHEKYVQDSVANWLNDVAKSQPDWVEALCARWQAQNPSPRTARICARALRSLSRGAALKRESRPRGRDRP
jgi:3-methyladenine DNA glycosylase AlkC